VEKRKEKKQMMMENHNKSLTKILFTKNYKKTDVLAKVDVDVNNTFKKFKLEPDTEIGVSLYQTSRGRYCLTVLTKPFN
jgi:hypothetical protein